MSVHAGLARIGGSARILALVIVMAVVLAALPATQAQASTSVVGAESVSIAGTVIRPAQYDTSMAVGTINVWAAEGLTLVATVSPSFDGAFQVSVPPGEYRIEYFSHSSSILTMWWGDAQNRASARVLTVTSEGVHDLEIRPVTPSWISGRMISVPAYPDYYSIELYDANGSRMTSHPVSAGTDDFQFSGLYPGTYKIAYRIGIGGASTRYWRGGSDFTTAEAITVSESIARLSTTELREIESTIPDPPVRGVPLVGQPLNQSLPFEHQYYGDHIALTYRWLADGVAIPGESRSSLDLTPELAGKRIALEVTAQAPGYLTSVRRSAPTAPVALRTLQSGGMLLEERDEMAVGTPISVGLTGSWSSGTEFSYRWFADDIELAEHENGMRIPQAAAGRRISVEVTAALPGYASVVLRATASRNVDTLAMSTAVPTIVGELAHRSTVTAVPGRWTAGTEFSYQWYADGVAIPGATGASFTIGASQRSTQLSVRVTGRNQGYTTASRTSARTVRVTMAGAAAIGGYRAVGARLTATPGTWLSGTTFAYQWYANGVAIPGATSSTLTLSSAMEHRLISVKVVGRRTGFATVARVSEATARVTRVGTPSVSGRAAVGSVLSAVRGTWTTGMAFRYQWYANGVAISGATAATFTPAAVHRGKVITVRVTGVRTGYASATKVSAPTAKLR